MGRRYEELHSERESSQTTVSNQSPSVHSYMMVELAVKYGMHVLFVNRRFEGHFQCALSRLAAGQ